MAPLFISRQAYAPFRGYIEAQRARMFNEAGQRNVTRPELIERYGFDTKYAGHVIRLGYQGVELLSTGRITLPMPEEQRQHVIDVRTGRYKLEQIRLQIRDLQFRLEFAQSTSQLRSQPDYLAIEKWMVQKYKDHWSNT